MYKIGIADTTFARFDMASLAKRAIEDSSLPVRIVRYTVPGVKDLPVACKRLFDEEGCDIVMALGMPGPEPIDKQCAHEASLGLINVQLLTNKHIIEVFVHMDEAHDGKDLISIVKDRTRKHTVNALKLLKGRQELINLAGQGVRQGRSSVGPLLSTL